MAMLDFIKKVMSGATEESSKRFIGVTCMMLFGVLFLLLIILLPLVLFKAIPASQTTINLYFATMDKTIYYAFVIILVAIGAVALVNVFGNVGDALSGKALASIIAAQKGTPDTVVKNDVVQNQNIDKGAPVTQQNEVKGG